MLESERKAGKRRGITEGWGVSRLSVASVQRWRGLRGKPEENGGCEYRIRFPVIYPTEEIKSNKDSLRLGLWFVLLIASRRFDHH